MEKASDTANKSDNRTRIVVALIGAVALPAAALVGRVTAPQDAATPPTTPAPSGPVKVTIDQAPGDIRRVAQLDTYTGTVRNLKRGQMVWLFNQPLTTANGKPVDNTTIYADSGPCVVDEEAAGWTCQMIGVGEEGAAGVGRYKIWVSVVDESQAFELVQVLRGQGGYIGDSGVPPHVGTPDQTIVMRKAT